MADVGGGERDPGYQLVTGYELLADLMQTGDTLQQPASAEQVTRALGGITAERSRLTIPGGAAREAFRWPAQLSLDWAAQASDEARKVRDGTASPRLQEVINHVFGDDEGTLAELPPADQLLRVTSLDTVVRIAASQPVIVIKPGKTWMDFGMLDKLVPHDSATAGLQRSQSLREGSYPIVLPVLRSLTVDIRSLRALGPQEREQDDELRARDMQTVEELGESSRPVVDPLATRVLLTPEDDGLAPADEVTAYVLAGRVQLHRLLNHMLSFDMNLVDSDETVRLKFHAAMDLQKRLEDVGIRFDIDLIDGYLAYRIASLKQEIDESGPLKKLNDEQDRELAVMQHKYGLLVAGGYISEQIPK